MWKAVLIFVACFLAGVMLAVPSLLNSLSSVPAMLQGVWTQLQSYGVTPMQLISAVGSVVAVGGVIIAKLRSSLAKTKAEADAKIQTAQAYATQQQQLLTQQTQNLQGTVTTQTQQINDLQAKLAEAQTANANALQYRADYEKLQNEYNIMERTYQNALAELKQKTVTVVK
jgi:predicted RNase H-like nuclease (RuvC/YqgF family)